MPIRPQEEVPAPQGAAQGVRAMMFLDKFGEEVQYAFEALDA